MLRHCTNSWCILRASVIQDLSDLLNLSHGYRHLLCGTDVIVSLNGVLLYLATIRDDGLRDAINSASTNNSP